MVAADPARCPGTAAVAIVTVMETLGEDLLLLAVRPSGKLGATAKLRFGLSGSKLVRLAAGRRVDIVRGRIVVLDAAPTGDDLLDAALRAATSAAVDASVLAATDAAVAASIDAATQGAISASADAAGHHHGGAAGGHH